MCKRLHFLFFLLISFVANSSNFDEESIYHDYVEGNLCYTILDNTSKEAEVSGTTLKSSQSINRETTLYSITIPNTVTIGGTAYKVTTVANNAFRGCSNIEAVIVDDGVIYIGKSAFENCSLLNKIYLSPSVAYIGDCAFSDCSRLTEVNIPDSVGFIGKGAFKNCTLLEHLYIPYRVNQLEASVFEGCSNLASISVAENNQNMMSVDGVLYNKELTTLICCPDARTSALTLPKSVSVISWRFSSLCQLSCISCSSTVPPVVSYAATSPLKVSLFVPKRLVPAYQQAIFWSDFTIKSF